MMNFNKGYCMILDKMLVKLDIKGDTVYLL